MPFLRELLDDLFTPTVYDGEDAVHIAAIQDHAKVFANAILDHSPPSADQTVAIRKLRESCHVACDAVRLKGRA
jgi:hypothetical protein